MHLVWFRRDLRVSDNPALFNACAKGREVKAIHIETPDTWARHHMGENQQTWLQQNLNCLEKDLNALGIPLERLKTPYFSDCPTLILDFITHHALEALYFNHEYAWDERKRDKRVIEHLTSHAIHVELFHDQNILQPDSIFNKQGNAYTVFTPYKKTCIEKILLNPQLLSPLPKPTRHGTKLTIKQSNQTSVTSPLHILPGTQAAKSNLHAFLHNKIADYHHNRDLPELDATSKLSPYLALGIISVRQCIEALFNYYETHEFSQILSNEGTATWVSELLWRDFYNMICFQYPHVSRNQPFQTKAALLTWDDKPHYLEAWKNGQTGVPLVDAAMRQLNQTGWMHNRLRMVVGMYLSKNLWCDWRQGEAYFASQLIDWDFASNNGGWQWCASTGTDAAPYFRVFNPINQSERFDSQGNFIRKYCPELMSLDNKKIHDPHHRGIKNLDYPKPLVDLKLTRAFAIESFKFIKNT